MSSFDMEVWTLSPASPVNDNKKPADPSTVRRLVIVAFVGTLAITAALIGFSLQ